MIPSSVRRSLALVLAVVASGLTLTACESSQDKAAKLAGSDSQQADVGKGVSVTKENPDVEVGTSAVVSDANGAAAAVRLKNTGSRPLYSLPIEIQVLDAKGEVAYSNTDPGLEPVLTLVPSIPAGGEVWWVNEQVALTEKAKDLKVKVGSSTAKGSSGSFSIGDLRAKPDPAGGVAAVGVVRNQSKSTARNVFVSIVATRGGKPVAAGKSMVDKISPSGSASFDVILIGNPNGAVLQGSAATLPGG